MGAMVQSRAKRQAQRTGIDGSHEMSTVPLYPLRFTPILRRLIWGGRRLGTVLHKPIGDASDYAESWEISDYRDSVSVLENGSLAGSTIRELIQWYSPGLLGPALAGVDQFPLLVKYIDAHQDLSVQVHPDDAKGRRLAGDSGKTETWVILEAEPGSVIYAGLAARSRPERIRRQRSVREASSHCSIVSSRKPGDCILIESGTVHAIGAGVLLAEIQQTSDATFRVYDWGRVGPDGKPRTLHIEQALESIEFERGPVKPITPRRRGTAGRWHARAPIALGLFRSRTTQHHAADVGRTTRSVHDSDEPGGLVRRAAPRRKPCVLNSVRQCCFPLLWLGARLFRMGECQILTCIVPE